MPEPDPPAPPTPAPAAPAAASSGTSLMSWLGLNRAALAVLVVIGGLGFSEELWRGFFGPYLRQITRDLEGAVGLLGLFSALLTLFEGLGYILGGALAHRLGARIALAASALPMLAGFLLLLTSREPWAVVLGALLVTNWEPLSVPATFDVVGSEIPKDRRTIAFAVQSIQKRLPKVLGPLAGGFLFALGYGVNLSIALTVVLVALALQWGLLARLRPKSDPPAVPWRHVLRALPPDLRALLTAEIFLRWGDWFVRDFASLYVVGVLARSEQEWGMYLALTSLTALATYIPVGKWVDRAPSPKPFIGVTFLLFALFPINLALLPKSGLPLPVALGIVFVLNGLRELGEPARKALITTGFPPEVRARAVGLYWGLRSLAFCPAPLVAAFLWRTIGPDATFLVGGAIGLVGTAWFWWRVRAAGGAASPPLPRSGAPDRK
ncbi:MAG: MFS transporter [Planctomycetes bacterium]|nr:MFS transporter [Planctomycetota bacterium]